MLLGWPNTVLLLMSELASPKRDAMIDAYTKPKLISPHTAAFVDSGILTFQTT